MTEDQEIDGQIPCPECSALNPAGAKFCADCGCLQVTRVTPKPARRSGGERREVTTDAVAKSRARQEFARTKNIVLTVRFVYWTSAILAALHIALWHTALEGVVKFAYGDWHLPFTFVVYAQFALMVAGSVFVLRGALVWTVIGACNWTLNTVMQWWVVSACVDFNNAMERFRVDERVELGMLVVFVGFWTLMLVAFWFAVAQAARVQRLMAENPELSIVRRRFDPSQRVEGGVADHVRSRRQKERGEIWRGRLKVAGMAAGGLVVVITFLWYVTRPPTVDATLGRFSTMWSTSDIEGIHELMSGGAIREGLERRGWLTALPELGEPEIDAGRDRGAAEYPCGNGRLGVKFTRTAAGWQVLSIDLPPIEPKELQPALDAFRAAWNAPGMDRLIAQFRPASRERLGGQLRRLFERRGWDQDRPELGGVDPGRIRDGRVRVLFGLKFDELTVGFAYWHPQWHLVSLRPPS